MMGVALKVAVAPSSEVVYPTTHTAYCLGYITRDIAARRHKFSNPETTGYYNNTVNVVSTVHCLFGGCRTGRSLSGAMSQVTQKEARGAAPAAAAQPPPRRSSRRCRRPRYGRAAESSRCHCRAPHDAERSTPAALGRARPVRTHMLSPLSISATQAQAAAGGANSASHRTWRSVRAGAQAPASTSRQLRRGQIPGERRRRRPGLPGDTAAASLRTKSARVLPALASSGRTSTSSARISTGPARC